MIDYITKTKGVTQYRYGKSWDSFNHAIIENKPRASKELAKNVCIENTHKHSPSFLSFTTYYWYLFLSLRHCVSICVSYCTTETKFRERGIGLRFLFCACSYVFLNNDIFQIKDKFASIISTSWFWRIRIIISSLLHSNDFMKL